MKVTERRVRQELIKLKHEFPANKVLTCAYTRAGGATDRCIAGEVYYRIIGSDDLDDVQATIGELWQEADHDIPLENFELGAVRLLEAAQLSQDGDVLKMGEKLVRQSPTMLGPAPTRPWAVAVDWALENYNRIEYIS